MSENHLQMLSNFERKIHARAIGSERELTPREYKGLFDNSPPVAYHHPSPEQRKIAYAKFWKGLL